MDGWIIGVLVLIGTLTVEYIVIRNFRSRLTHVVQFVLTLAFLGGLCVSANFLFAKKYPSIVEWVGNGFE